MPSRRLPGYRRAVFVLAMVVGLIAALAVPAFASHGSTTIDVGNANDGTTGRDNYDDSDITVVPGTTVTFFFDNGFHNVVWTSANPGGLADSPGAPGGDAVGTSYTVTPTVAGTYIYFCSIHTDAATALAATDFSDPRPAEMYGRIIVQADNTPPVWDAGSATATAVSGSQIDLTWPAANDPESSVQYEVYEAQGATQPAKPASPATTVAGTSLSRTGLASNTHYWYWITATNGTVSNATDQQADATTLSVNASADTSQTVQFSVNPALSINVTPSLLDLGTLNPLTAPTGTGQATVNVESNATWTLNLRSIGADGVSGGGDDAFFTSGGNQIPVSRATWDDPASGGGPAALSDVDATVVTGQPAGASAVTIDYSITLQSTDPAGTSFQTVILYTVTQP